MGDKWNIIQQHLFRMHWRFVYLEVIRCIYVWQHELEFTEDDNDDEEREEEQPTVVVLKKGDLTAEEAKEIKKSQDANTGRETKFAIIDWEYR